MAVSEIGWSWRLLCHRHRHRHRHMVKVNQPNTPLFLQIPMPIRITTSSTRLSNSCVVRAVDPKTEDQNSTSSSQEDLVYVAKLLCGSFAGAGAIKYGSALFPEITTPNLVAALLIILSPVLVAVFLLIKESRTNSVV